ncbi:hypothetical protein WN51_11915 [Melipona quadrifasciata]|uniref:Uncharacterized protein n=1 Tax=Melipona quadrifasciata TaxID=166423 RepID=A0A0M9A2W7_9HYME|nr:hypothetical protein WN51_11915 [Melipona quadrifasciata]
MSIQYFIQELKNQSYSPHTGTKGRQKREEQQEKRKLVVVQNFQKKLQEYSIPQLKTTYHSELNIWKPRVKEQNTPTAESRLKSFEATCATRGVSARGPGSNSSTARVKSASLGTDEPGIDSTRHRLELVTMERNSTLNSVCVVGMGMIEFIWLKLRTFGRATDAREMKDTTCSRALECEQRINVTRVQMDICEYLSER